MTADNLTLWKALAEVPKAFQKTIQGGRLKGFTDINPQGRWLMLTEAFGPCGVGWRYEIAKTWSEPGADGEVLCFVQADLYFRHDALDGWSGGVAAIGGSKLIAKESGGMHSSDEGYKMALTDALGKAAAMIGLGANVYLGASGSKYSTEAASAPVRAAQPAPKAATPQPSHVPLGVTEEFPEDWKPSPSDQEEGFPEGVEPEDAQDGFPDWGEPDDPGPQAPPDLSPPSPPPPQAAVLGTDWKGDTPSDTNDPACPICHGQMWDNREPERGGQGRFAKKKATAPDFKCRDKECDGLYWPIKKR